MILLASFFTSTAFANQFNFDKLYHVDTTGWMKKGAPNGFVYVCIPCKKDVDIQISFGYEMDNKSILEYKKIESKFLDKQYAKKFSKEMIAKQIPINNVTINVAKIETGYFFNLKMLEYIATIEMYNTLMHGTGFIGLQGNRIVMISINYSDGSMDKTARKNLKHFLSSLMFREITITKDIKARQL